MSNNVKVTTNQTVKIVFKLNGIKSDFKMKCYVLDACSASVIFNNEFLINNNCIFNFTESSYS